MPDEEPTYECQSCEDQVEGEKEFCLECDEGPYCPGCKLNCEFGHTPEGKIDQHVDQQIAEWKERNIV